MKSLTNKMLYDFVCPTGHEFEEFVYSNEREAKCECGLIGQRQMPTPRIDKYGMSLRVGATPTSIDYFDKVHRQQKVIEERAEREHGDYGVAPGGDGGGSYAPLDTSGAVLESSDDKT